MIREDNQTVKTHKKIKIETGVYKYRGFWCCVNEETPTGYWGRWSASTGIITDSLKNCMRQIDGKLDK